MGNGLYLKVGIALLASLIISFISTPIVKQFAHRVGAIDVPDDNRRVHDHPIPRMGGLAIFLGFILSVVLFADVTLQVRGILLGSLLVVIVGVIDDIVPLPAWLKFLLQIVAAFIAVFHGVRIEIIANPNIFSNAEYLIFGGFSIPITVIWIVAVTNSVNLIDGLDGLAVGVSTIATVTMLVIALVVSDGNVAVILAALAGACIGFMPYNMNPAELFMGDTGALLLGYVLATMSVVGLFKFFAIISFVVPFIVLGLPIFDTAFAFFRRLIRGQNPMKPDRKHFHHRLIDMGLSQKQAVAILYGISGILGLIAILIITTGEVRAIMVLVTLIIVALMAAFIMNIKKTDAQDTAVAARPEDDADTAEKDGTQSETGLPDSEGPDTEEKGPDGVSDAAGEENEL